jgi:ABC-type nickel/cobalt efflux system permease component RcnA
MVSPSPKVEEYTPKEGDRFTPYLFMVIHAVDYSRKDGVFATSELNFFLGKNFLVTYHVVPLKSVTMTEERCLKGTVHIARAPDRVADSGFASLVGRDRLGFWVIVASLGAALFWGMAHALSPGHGKTIVTAYLVGQRGTPRHAALLGLVVTATHTVGVFALGAVTLLLSRFIVPEQLYPWLNFVSGVLVVLIGASVLRARARHRRTHAHGHQPDHHHGRDHGLSRRSLLAVGVSGGLLPCPSALVVLLAAISLHRVAFGMLLVVAFSVGLALTITGIGLVAVLARGAFRRFSFEGRVVSLLPTASALVIVAAGLVMTLHALPEVG